MAWCFNLLELTAGIVLAAVFLRDNIAAYLAVAFTAALAGPLVGLLRGPNPFFRWNGIALAALAVAGLAWLLVPRGKSQVA